MELVNKAPTFYDLSGGKKPLPKELDGGSLRSLLENGNQGAVQRNVEPLVFHYPWYDSVPMSVIRQGDYKLVKDLNTDQTRLFNAVKDLGLHFLRNRPEAASSESAVKLI